MRPDESNIGQGGTLDPTPPSQKAAAQIVRAQIDNLYENNTSSEVPQQQLESSNPYQRTHTEHSNPQSEQWKQYHTAWQNYYQKYYEGYYTHHLRKSQHTLEEQIANSHINDSQGYFDNQPAAQSEPDRTTSTGEAVFDLHQKLLGKVQESATKVRKSRHFIPIASGIIVVLLFLFLQYNRIIISNVMAYVSPGNINPQNIVIDPSSDIKVGPESRLIIPKINVDVPVFYDISSDYNSQMAAMAKGVAQFAIPGASSHPGQIGNTVIAGHSSNDLFDTGDYKFIFVQLDKLVAGDTIYANYQSIRYTYIVTRKDIVKPNDVSKLVYPTTKPILTLLTCTPVGTANSRLLVIAEQVSPDPNQSTAAPITENANQLSIRSIPGNSPNFFDWLFGGSKY
jgi:sortase A